jgi:hypothetical protein
MMNPKLKLAISSYVRSYFVAVVGMITIGEDDYKKIAITALAVGVVGPAIRAVNPKDPAFGLIADKAEVEIKKLVVADKKKATKKKA